MTLFSCSFVQAPDVDGAPIEDIDGIPASVNVEDVASCSAICCVLYCTCYCCIYRRFHRALSAGVMILPMAVYLVFVALAARPNLKQS